MAPFTRITVDTDIVDRLRRGDRAAAEAVYQLLAEPVQGLASRILKDRQLAAEVTQDTFVEVIEKAAHLEHPGALVGWVRTIAVNQCLARLRSPWYRRRDWLAPADESLTHSHTPRPDEARDVDQALATLSAQTRFVVWMHDVEGYTHKEIGEALGKTESFSKSRLARAHVHLLAWYEASERNGVKGDERSLQNGTA
ncbi:MAG: RNA polymerase sigma factor [Gammaproteobacteria bacterium]|nr:RNA polymerase sigma factor [Gammaproteobacteria bacterium]